MYYEQRGSLLGSIIGIIVCGGVGGVSAWALVTALGWDGLPGAIAAAIIGMIVATAAWAAGTTLLRTLGLIR
jgi:hypothetical protein